MHLCMLHIFYGAQLLSSCSTHFLSSTSLLTRSVRACKRSPKIHYKNAKNKPDGVVLHQRLGWLDEQIVINSWTINLQFLCKVRSVLSARWNGKKFSLMQLFADESRHNYRWPLILVQKTAFRRSYNVADFSHKSGCSFCIATATVTSNENRKHSEKKEMLYIK